MSRRSLAYAQLLLAVAAALAAPAAHASHEDDSYATVLCSFAGLSGMANPGPAAVVPDLTDLLDVDHGSFTLEGDMSCAGADVAGSDQPLLPLSPNNLHIAVVGHYDNQVCGTGTARGTAKITDNANSPQFVDVDATIGIDFVAGFGKLQIVVEDGEDGRIQTKPGTPNPDNVVHSGRGSGVVQLTLLNVGDCLFTNVTQFAASGGFQTVLAGDASDDIDP
jgi:hypothetical protein